jgi:hypothetical protein
MPYLYHDSSIKKHKRLLAMEFFLLMSITGLIGLTVSAGILYKAHRAQSELRKRFYNEDHNALFRRLKLNANRLK